MDQEGTTWTTTHWLLKDIFIKDQNAKFYQLKKIVTFPHVYVSNIDHCKFENKCKIYEFKSQDLWSINWIS